MATLSSIFLKAAERAAAGLQPPITGASEDRNATARALEFFYSLFSISESAHLYLELPPNYLVQALLFCACCARDQID